MTDQPTPETVTTAAHNDALLRLHVTTAERDALRADRKKLVDLLNEAAASAHHDGYDESVELWRTVASHLDRFRDAAAAERDALRAALELIASPMRPDGTYNRDRAACGTLARATLDSLTR
jgi:hypothetical protein